LVERDGQEFEESENPIGLNGMVVLRINAALQGRLFKGSMA
jgi:hypothetical protein